MVSGASGCGSNTNFALAPVGAAPTLGLDTADEGRVAVLPGAITEGTIGASTAG